MSIVTLTFYAIGIIFSSRASMCHKFGQDIYWFGLYDAHKVISIFVNCKRGHWHLTFKINLQAYLISFVSVVFPCLFSYLSIVISQLTLQIIRLQGHDV